MEDLEAKIQKLYGDVRLTRVYHCKDGRRRIDLVGPDYRRTFQIARLIIEAELGRTLTQDETVDHINGDKTNDAVENLRVLTLSQNSADSAIKLVSQDFTCPNCNSEFTLTKRRLKDAVWNRMKGKAGPFCGRSCAGTYSANIGHNKTDKLSVIQINRRYYSNKHADVS